MEEDNNILKHTDTKTIALGVVACAIFALFSFLFGSSLSDCLKNHFQLDYKPFFIGLCLSIFLVSMAFVVYFRISKTFLILRKIHNILILATKIFIIIIVIFICYAIVFQRTDNQYIFGLLLFSLCVIIPSIVSGFLLSTRSNCSMIHEVDEFREKIKCAVTATCIPLQYNESTNQIITYLYLNPKYETKEWMFPGGHAFIYKIEDYWFPEDVAKRKAEIEVGTIVNILDLDDSREVPTGRDICVKKMTPHFVYYFKLTERVMCYKKGHRFHYDCIYIGEITDFVKKFNENKRKEITLPLACTATQEQVKQVVSETINREEDTETRSLNIEYVSKMLFNALVNYKKHKNIQ